jgi:hypothetical protein
MTTYYIRSSRDGMIVNAVDCDTRDQATEVANQLTGGPYFTDDDPPLHVLQQYRYWDERP